jgi:hypothetical protein
MNFILLKYYFLNQNIIVKENIKIIINNDNLFEYLEISQVEGNPSKAYYVDSLRISKIG